LGDPYIGEIRVFGFTFAPRGWAQCQGQLLPISQNAALFSILGTTYGGDGRATFALPNFQGMVGIGAGQGPGRSNRDLGETGGEEQITLTAQQMAVHAHAAGCSSANGNAYGPAGNFWAQDAGGANDYASAGNAQMSANAIGQAGGSMPHPNLQPYLVLNYCIALQGVYPSRS
jgi:microcystin-dependent protein